MKNDRRTQSETLNAYLDGELDDRTVAALRQRLAGDAALARHLRELEQVRALTRAAFPIEPETATVDTQRPAWGRRFGIALAAMLLLGLGIGMGLSLQMPTTSNPRDELANLLPPQAQIIRPVHLDLEVPNGELRAVFHVTSGDARTIRSTLDHIERLLNHYARQGKPLHVELVANADGLNALRADTTPVREQIAQLHSSYPNIRFLACGTTIERVQRAQGQKVKLVPDAAVAASALDQIVLRLRQGWTYVRI